MQKIQNDLCFLPTYGTGKAVCKSINLWLCFYFKDLFLFVLFSFLLSLSLFLCSWTCSPMQDSTDLALLKASPSEELWKKLHVYIWNCSKVTVSMVSLLLVYSSSSLFPTCLEPGLVAGEQCCIFAETLWPPCLLSRWRREVLFCWLLVMKIFHDLKNKLFVGQKCFSPVCLNIAN